VCPFLIVIVLAVLSGARVAVAHVELSWELCHVAAALQLPVAFDLKKSEARDASATAIVLLVI
jgi:hypothetical protein